ncbi:retrovirus-related pol polyprotein from transposon TNT 1-94 [Tanacetum coccineum]
MPSFNKRHLLMPCPCTKCLNHIEHKVEEVQFHLFRNGIDLSYTNWTRHGEKDEPSISAPKPINAITGFVDDTDFASNIPTYGPAIIEKKNCIQPAGNEMVEKTYQAKKVMKLMGSGYKKIHVCINNCLLYWKNDKDLTACQTCGISRWKVDNKTQKVYENIPAKVMWYFPIIPRLQRLFKIQSILEDLRWHATRRITDGVLRHPADSQAWRTIDEKFPEIAEDPRNLRLGISADGVDVNTGNRHHSVWPVLTVIYNLPPWLCMKRKFIIAFRKTIAEETIEFFSEYHKSMETIGIPPDKHETDENEVGKPLSADKSSEVSTKLFQKAHLYVIQNTDEIVPYIKRHRQVLKTENPGKRIAFLENEHSKSFAKWLRKEVERELAISKESVSKTVRWISYGPRATVVKYDAYNINGYTFRTKCHDGKVYQNSGVSVEAIDLHISKEVATTRQAFYYGVLQEIWVLDYRFRQIPLFKCDWVNHRAGGVKRDTTLGLHITFAACICTLHLQLAFASKHLHIAFADCICTLHLYIAFAACICKQAFAHCTCTLHLQAKVLIKTLLKVKQVENKQREKKPRFK